jgi:hypothetical protein
MSTDSAALGLEMIPADEEEAIRQLAAVSEQQMKAKSQNPTLRDQHPKSHGYALGEFIVGHDLPELYRHGVFARSASYSCWVRFSNGTSGSVGPMAT